MVYSMQMLSDNHQTQIHLTFDIDLGMTHTPSGQHSKHKSGLGAVATEPNEHGADLLDWLAEACNAYANCHLRAL